MPIVENKRILEHRLELLYDVITDVESYSEFIPWCKKVTIITEKTNEVISDVNVEFLFIKEKYRSIANFEPPQKKDGDIIAKVDIEMLEGPFEYFSTIWILKSVNENKTLVDFKCDFSFKNKIYDGIASTVLMAANDKIINAFVKRTDFVSKKS
jgi:coenzyme Q-binding protein COQ10